MKSDSESDDQDNEQSVSFWEDDDSVSDDDDGDNEVEKNAYNAFSFCQIVAEDGQDDWENDSPSSSVDGEHNDDEVKDISDDTLDEPFEAAKLERVLSEVAA